MPGRIDPRSEYIGDGVYAHVDEMGQIWLQTERGIGNIHEIALERSVFEALIKFANWKWGPLGIRWERK